VRLTAELLGVTSPLRTAPPCELLVEAASDREDGGDLVARLADVVSRHDPGAETALAEDPEARRRLWAVRERHSELVGLLGEPHKLDVSLPLGELASFEADVRAALAERLAGCVPVLFGHLGDGGMHVNVAVPPGTRTGTGTELCGGPVPGGDDVADVVFPVVAAHGGSISAEHGVGTDKVRWLSLARSPGEIDAMRRVKDALDPGSLLNPGVVLPVPP
jgi:FAD/FMN-containing dehydrogenase